MRHFPLILAVAAALALGALAATALWGGEPALQSVPAEPLETTERITGAPQPGPTPGGEGLQPPKVRLLQNIRNFSARDLLLDDAGVSRSVKRVLDRCGPGGIDNPIYADLTRDFVDDVILPVVHRDGRISDVFVYSRAGRRIKRVFEYHGPELSAEASGRFFSRKRDLLIYDFAYAPGDRRCCPSELTFSRFRWDGSEFVRVRRQGL
ncbi:MAG: hypothetical protein ACR2OC_00160 [Solirubrobacterales bacterium]